MTTQSKRTDISPKKTHTWLIYMKRCLISIIIRETEIKTTMRNHLTPVEMAVIKKATIKAGERVERGNPPTLLVGI